MAARDGRPSDLVISLRSIMTKWLFAKVSVSQRISFTSEAYQTVPVDEEGDFKVAAAPRGQPGAYRQAVEAIKNLFYNIFEFLPSTAGLQGVPCPRN